MLKGIVIFVLCFAIVPFTSILSATLPSQESATLGARRCGREGAGADQRFGSAGVSSTNARKLLTDSQLPLKSQDAVGQDGLEISMRPRPHSRAIKRKNQRSNGRKDPRRKSDQAKGNLAAPTASERTRGVKDRDFETIVWPLVG